MFSALMDVSRLFKLLSRSPFPTLFFSKWDFPLLDFVIGPIHLTCYIDFFALLLAFSSLSAYICTLFPCLPFTHLSTHLFLSLHHCHQAVSANQGRVQLIAVHQIIIETFHSDEVRGIIQCSPVSPVGSHVGVTCLYCRSQLLPRDSALPLGASCWGVQQLHWPSSYSYTPMSYLL